MKRKLNAAAFGLALVMIVALAVLVPIGFPSHGFLPGSGLQDKAGYLEGTADQLAARVPPPPQGTAVANAERQVFTASRALQGSSRWAMAAHDANHSPRSLLRDFSCAAGVELSADRAPHLASLLRKAGADAALVAQRVKDKFGRARPYVLYGGPICQSSAGLGANGDYPSGHSARGWAWGLVLAELVPNRREQIIARAKAYADSRVICGVHSTSGAEAGLTVARLTVNSLMQKPQFKADMQSASTELAALLQHGPALPVEQCRSEQRVLARTY